MSAASAERNHAGAADVRPIVERMPTSALCADGPRIELPVSVPSPTVAVVRGDGGGGAAARAGGHAIERVRILRVAGQDRAHRLVRRERQLRHVRLGEHDGAGVADASRPCVASCVGIQPAARAIRRSSGRSCVSKLSFTIIGMQCSGPMSPSRANRRSSESAIVERLRIGEDDRVDRRPLLVERVDAVAGTAEPVAWQVSVLALNAAWMPAMVASVDGKRCRPLRRAGGAVRTTSAVATERVSSPHVVSSSEARQGDRPLPRDGRARRRRLLRWPPARAKSRRRSAGRSG